MTAFMIWIVGAGIYFAIWMGSNDIVKAIESLKEEIKRGK